MEKHAQEEHVVRGIVQRVTFRNPQNGYSVLKLETSEKSESLTVVGCCPEANVGTNLVVRGVFVEHPRFGRQLSARSITTTLPATAEGIEKFLESGLIKGIGSKTARKLIQKFGANALEIARKDPKAVAGIQGIGRHKADIISNALKEQTEVQETLRFLLEHGITAGLATRIYEKFKNRTIEILSKDPFLLARDMRGVGFLTADSIAMKLGIQPNAPQRLKAGLFYALEKAADDGHCYLLDAELSDKARSLLGIGDEYDLEPHLKSLIDEGFLVKEEDAIYLLHLHRSEEFVANFVADRAHPLQNLSVSRSLIENGLKRAEHDLGVKFSAEQQGAVHGAFNYRLSIITGGPGCGKTTVIRALVAIFKQTSKSILLAAPTGRAAQRMSQVCDMPASTIHRLLRYEPMSGRFQHGINDPLIADVIIIDESSMIDIQLAKDLFAAIPGDATLILVGDKDQLPSVGPGRVFGELVSIKEVKSACLSQLFRRAEESSINTVAHMINSGILPTIPEPDGVTKADAYFLARSDLEEAALTIEKLVADQIPKKFGFEPNEITVLTPSNRGPLGTQALNARLQNRLNPKGSIDSEQELEMNNLEFRIGDRVCQRVNNYNIDPNGVFNGDLGQIYSVDRKTRSLMVEMWDGRLIKYNSSDIAQLSLAYAITVHRSQGSESPCVILALHDSHYTLLERQLIYTGVTRAKRLLIVVGSKRALLIGTKRTSATKRRTMLRKRVQAKLNSI